MSAPRLSDQALLRMLAISGVDIEEVRGAVQQALSRAHTAAIAVGGGDHLIVVDGLCYVVRDGVVTTVTKATRPHHFAGLLSVRPTR